MPVPVMLDGFLKGSFPLALIDEKLDQNMAGMTAAASLAG